MISAHFKTETCSLHLAPLDTPIEIESIEDMSVAAQVLRMGISLGSRIIATTRLPNGPTVVRCGAVELALGQEISRQIQVSQLSK